MKLKLHHVNLCSTNVPAMDTFYRDVLDMETEPTMARQRITDQGYPGNVAFVTDGTTQFHLAEKDMNIGFRTGNVVNPVERGHIAFRTDDIAAFKKRLDEKGVALFRLRRLGDDRLAADLLLRSRRQRHRGASGAGGRAVERLDCRHPGPSLSASHEASPTRYGEALGDP